MTSSFVYNNESFDFVTLPQMRGIPLSINSDYTPRLAAICSSYYQSHPESPLLTLANINKLTHDGIQAVLESSKLGREV